MFLFQHDTTIKNKQVLTLTEGRFKLLAMKYNSQSSQLVHLLYGQLNINTNTANPYKQYHLYLWNTVQNSLIFDYISDVWNCTIKCQISATNSFFLIQDSQQIFLHQLNDQFRLNGLISTTVKNSVNLLKQIKTIRRKADIFKNTYLFTAAGFIQTKCLINNSVISNKFILPQNYQFNQNNVAMDTKLFQNHLYILYRNTVNFDIYLYQFSNISRLFDNYKTQPISLNSSKIVIKEIFRFTNNYKTRVIRLIRGINRKTNQFVFWVYNQNQAYKCSKTPCIGIGYQLYQNLMLSSVGSSKYLMAFFGSYKHLSLKNFKPSLMQEDMGNFEFSEIVTCADITFIENKTHQMITTFKGSLFPNQYTIVNDCHSIFAAQSDNFCKCTLPYHYNNDLKACSLSSNDQSALVFSSFIIVIMAMSLIIFLTALFIIYRKWLIKRTIRKSWKYNAADHIIFQ